MLIIIPLSRLHKYVTDSYMFEYLLAPTRKRFGLGRGVVHLPLLVLSGSCDLELLGEGVSRNTLGCCLHLRPPNLLKAEVSLKIVCTALHKLQVFPSHLKGKVRWNLYKTLVACCLKIV